MPRRSSSHSPDWGEFGRRPAFILAAVVFIDAVERGILPGVLSDAQDDLGFNDFQAGLLGSAVIAASAVIVIPAGRMADRFNRPRMIAAVLASWGLVAACTAGVRSFGQFLAARAALGIADTIDNPASASLVADYYPATVRGRAFGILRIAPLIGTAVGTGVGGLVASTLGWRWAFLIVGVPGSLFALVVLSLPNPTRGRQEGVVEEIRDPSVSTLAQLRLLWRIPSLRGLAIGLGAIGMVLGIAFWSPSFFERHYDMSTSAAAGSSSLAILVGGLVGTWLGARRTDHRRAADPASAARDAGLAFAAATAAFMVGFGVVLPAGPAIVLLTIGVAAMASTLPGLFATIAEIVPVSDRGMAFSLAAFVSTAISAISAPLIGVIADQFEFTSTAGAADAAVEGDLRLALLIVMPSIAVGGLLVRSASRHILADRRQAGTAGE